jgi:hypothetical protein
MTPEESAREIVKRLANEGHLGGHYPDLDGPITQAIAAALAASGDPHAMTRGPRSCLCGWRAESPDTHPHVGGCEWADLLRERDEDREAIRALETCSNYPEIAHWRKTYAAAIQRAQARPMTPKEIAR